MHGFNRYPVGDHLWTQKATGRRIHDWISTQGFSSYFSHHVPSFITSTFTFAPANLIQHSFIKRQHPSTNLRYSIQALIYKMKFAAILALCTLAVTAMPHKRQLFGLSGLNSLSGLSNSGLSNFGNSNSGSNSANIDVATDGENSIANAAVDGDVNVNVDISDGKDDDDDSKSKAKSKAASKDKDN